jgi:hypothetical protein
MTCLKWNASQVRRWFELFIPTYRGVFVRASGREDSWALDPRMEH